MARILAFLLVFASASAAAAEDETGALKANSETFWRLAPYAAVLSGGLSSLEKNDGDAYPSAFDLDFAVTGDTAVRLYRRHAMRKTLSQGIEWTRTRGSGEYRRWEITTFESSPLLRGSLGAKYSVGTGRKHSTYALVHVPHLASGHDVDGKNRFLAVFARETIGRRHNIAAMGPLRAHWRWRENITLSSMGTVMNTKALTRMDRAYRVVMEPETGGNIKPYAYYEQMLDAHALAGSVSQLSRAQGSGERIELLLMNRSAGAGLAVPLSNGMSVSYDMQTDRHFRARTETVSLNGNLGRGLDLSVIYVRDRPDRGFSSPWQDEHTRIQLTGGGRNLSWGAFFEMRTGGNIGGVTMFRNIDANAPVPLVPESRYREPFSSGPTPPAWHTGSNLCGAFSTYEQAVAGLNTPERISEYAECLNYDFNSVGGKPGMPEEIFRGVEANCHSASWFQADMLSRHGYEAYVVLFQGSDTLFGQNEHSGFSADHAVTVYLNPDTNTWSVMEYQGILQTGAPTIQEALEAYSPNILAFIVEEPGNLLRQGLYLSPAMQTIETWIEDVD
jgi:hypothetical protein